MKTSDAGRRAIEEREGFRARAYKDVVGVWTCGYGHTGRAGPPKVTANMQISKADADRILASDLRVFEEEVSHAVKAPIGQNAFDACVSLAMNIGGGNFGASTVVHKINAGDMRGAGDAFLLWDKPSALKARRIAERAQFLSPDHRLPSVSDGPLALAPDAPKIVAAVAPPDIEPIPPKPARGFWARVLSG